MQVLLDAVKVGAPVPPTVKSFKKGQLYRPPGSFRCFYSAQAQNATGAVLAIKGMEPAANDFASLVASLQRPSYSPHTMAEHLIFEEGKAPGCVRLSEALHEARCAAAVQTAHVRAYLEPARLPLPLFVFKHTLSHHQRARTTLQPHLSPLAFETVGPLIDEGLGVYVYHYPSPPIRVRDLDTLLADLDFRKRLFALISICEPAELIQRWTRLFVRLLYLGFLPGGVHALRTGLCCQPQNACLDGGFVDLDSLTPFSALKGDKSVFSALQFSTASLLDTVCCLLAGAGDGGRLAPTEQLDRHLVQHFMSVSIIAAIRTEARPSLEFDRRADAFLGGPHTFEALVDALGSYREVNDGAFAREVRDFAEFGSLLVRSLHLN